jgi:TetR/AcrR family transcriptional repressor of nem operon
MRYPDGHKGAVRANILELAARALRRDGLSAVSIPALMKAAGLTHGGFYGYFESRDELVAQSVMLAAQQTGARVLSEEAGDLDGMLAGYLSEAHVNHPEFGCVVAALGTEAPKQSEPRPASPLRASWRRA